MNGIRITPLGEVTVQQLESPTWEALDKAVKGFFEIVSLFDCNGNRSHYLMVVNDCGAIIPLEWNRIASMLAGQSIYGNAIILKQGYNADGEPDCVGLNEVECASFIHHLIKSEEEIYNAIR